MERTTSAMESMGLATFYHGKKVFVTGHTGFKGAWLSLLLQHFGADVTAYALAPVDTRGNLCNLTGLESRVTSIQADINNSEELKVALLDSKAEIVFHLAAQALVIPSYKEPIETYQTNVMGTVNMLDAIRQSKTVKTAVMITTDKCYDNKEHLRPYTEDDRLGGHDPYSSSKAMAELAVHSYYKSFLHEQGVGVVTARAGNVIGGGDFADFRIIPDIVESIAKGQPVILRNPKSVRPWQHVLDAVYGYLLLGAKLGQDKEKFSTSFNFSPQDVQEAGYTVEYITQTFIDIFGQGAYIIQPDNAVVHEATYLQLDSTKARRMLGWQPAFTTEDGIKFTADWYKKYLAQEDSLTTTLAQIQHYLSLINP